MILTLALLLAQDSPFEPPVRLKAAGAVIDTGDEWGHAGPCVADVDRDGTPDLLVGDFSGRFRFYRNTGTAKAPSYAAPEWLRAGDAEAKVPMG
jgi:hypothetical protein